MKSVIVFLFHFIGDCFGFGLIFYGGSLSNQHPHLSIFPAVLGGVILGLLN